MLPPMSLESARAWLDARRNPDGSWGYLPGAEGAPEPTLLAAAAGLAVDLPWLAAAELGWGALLLPACLWGRPEARGACEAALDVIVAARGEAIDAEFDFDPLIPAWSWFPGTAPWAEPTAYAVLSLRRAGRGGHPRALDGERMLLDRQCDDGGWNYGNPAMLGTRLESELPTTGWVTLALPPSDATFRGLERLRDALEYRSATTLALAALAFAAHGRDPGPFAAALLERQQPDGSFTGRVDRTALACCALQAAETGGCAFFDAPAPAEPAVAP